MKLYVHSLVDKLKRFYENARCYNKIHSVCVCVCVCVGVCVCVCIYMYIPIALGPWGRLSL